MVKRYATLDEMYYASTKARPTLGFDTIMQLNQKLGIPNEPSEPPRGQQRDKPYREALRMELAAAREDLKK